MPLKKSVINTSRFQAHLVNACSPYPLQEVQNSTKKTPPPKSVVLLGDNESGRSTLIARMKGLDSISKGIGLEYHYIEVNNEEDRDGKLVWRGGEWGRVGN